MLQYDKLYPVSFNRLIVWLTTKHLRLTRILILTRAVVLPIVLLNDSFKRYRQAKLYQLMINGQVCYLERMLNDRYDFTQRRIRIGNATYHLPWYLYQEAELKPEYIYQEAENQPVILYTDGEAGETKDDFVVLVPTSLAFNENEMRSLLDAYKIFGTHYKIQRV